MPEPSLRPVILIGAARSGTKFLRDVIGRSAEFATVPYDVNYVWRMADPRAGHDALDPAQLSARHAERIRATLRSLAGLGAGDSRRLLEKTVSNTLRVPYVDAVFPDALFIHLVRDGHAVTESSLRMWQAPPDRQGLARKLRDLPLSNIGYVAWFAVNYAKGLLKGRTGGEVWGPRYPGILDDLTRMPLIEVVARQWAMSVQHADAALSDIPAERVLTVRYEDLMSDATQLPRLCAFLGIEDPLVVQTEFDTKADTRNLEKWRESLSESDIASIRKIAADELRRHGYLDR